VDETPNLGLPYIMAAQSQKHVTHNEAIRALDAIVQLSVLDRSLGAPPDVPVEGARYIVGSGPTGAWSGHAREIAAYQDGAWMFYTPREGWIAWVADEDVAVVWNGSTWVALTTGGGGGGGGEGDFSTLGVNATADVTNRLTVAASATLLNHEGTDHRLKINKAAAADTASLVYQTAFSGRAELGLAGDDDFHFKVSPDGANWKEAIVIDRATGGVSFPFTSLSGGREVLVANRTYYVRTDGSDGNNGLSNTSGGAFATLQKAIDVATGLDFSIYAVTIQLADGTYATGGLFSTSPNGPIVINGNSTTPANVVVQAANPIRATCPVKLTLQNFECQASSVGIWSNAPGADITIGTGMRISGSGVAMSADVTGAILRKAATTLTISGNKSAWLLVGGNAQVLFIGGAVTFSGTPTWGSYGIGFNSGGAITLNGVTLSGSAIGLRYYGTTNAVLNTGGAGTPSTYFPGSSDGLKESGAQQI